MKKYIQHIVLQTFFILIASLTFAQEGVSVSAKTNKDKIIIGEPIELTLEARIPTSMPSLWFGLDSIPHFEVIEKGKIDTLEDGNYRQTVIVTSFDSGPQMIAPLSLDLSGRSYLTDSLPVMVSYSAFDPKKDYHDIKDIIEVEAVRKDYLQYILPVSAAILLLILLIWYLSKKTKKAPAAVASFVNLSPYEEAIKSLEELKKQALSEKSYYTGLNDIMRWFIYRKSRVATMQKTNEEFILQLDRLSLPHEDFIALAQVLRMADAVKFAKYIPAEGENEKSYQVIRKSIEQLNNINNSAV